MVHRNIALIALLTALSLLLVTLSPVIPVTEAQKYNDQKGIGLASMQFFSGSKYRPLQKIARYTFERQRSLMKEIINTLRIRQNQHYTEATILRLGDDENQILSPYGNFSEALQEFHSGVGQDTYRYLNGVCNYNNVRLIVFSSIDEFMKDDFEQNPSGDVEISIDIYYPQMNAFQQEPVLISSGLLKTGSRSQLKQRIRDACAKTLKDAIDDKITLF